MIKDKLMLNNWLLVNGNYRWVRCLDNCIQVAGIDKWFSYSDEAIQGISLTPEILENCGFEFKKSGDFYTYENLISFSIDENGKIYRTWVYIDHPFMQIKHLHSLQNLYYALTGTELNVQL